MIRLQDLHVGLQLVHNCKPVELLYFERRNSVGELWRVRPLFTGLPEHPEVFRARDRISYLHTSRKAAQMEPCDFQHRRIAGPKLSSLRAASFQ